VVGITELGYALFAPHRLDRHLSLAGAGDWTTWGTAGGGVSIRRAVRLRWLDLAVSDRSDVGELGVLERARCLAARWALAVLLVRCDVEGDEEQQVGADDAHAGERGKLLAGALAGVRHPLEVGRGEIGVGGEVDEAWDLR